MNQETKVIESAIFDKLCEVIRDHFCKPKLEVTYLTTAHDVEGWDSLNHAMLLAAVEGALSVEIPYDQAASVLNVGGLVSLICSLKCAEPPIGGV